MQAHMQEQVRLTQIVIKTHLPDGAGAIKYMYTQTNTYTIKTQLEQLHKVYSGNERSTNNCQTLLEQTTINNSSTELVVWLMPILR